MNAVGRFLRYNDIPSRTQLRVSACVHRLQYEVNEAGVKTHVGNENEVQQQACSSDVQINDAEGLGNFKLLCDNLSHIKDEIGCNHHFRCDKHAFLAYMFLFVESYAVKIDF